MPIDCWARKWRRDERTSVSRSIAGFTAGGRGSEAGGKSLRLELRRGHNAAATRPIVASSTPIASGIRYSPAQGQLSRNADGAGRSTIPLFNAKAQRTRRTQRSRGKMDWAARAHQYLPVAPFATSAFLRAFALKGGRRRDCQPVVWPLSRSAPGCRTYKSDAYQSATLPALPAALRGCGFSSGRNRAEWSATRRDRRD